MLQPVGNSVRATTLQTRTADSCCSLKLRHR